MYYLLFNIFTYRSYYVSLEPYWTMLAAFLELPLLLLLRQQLLVGCPDISRAYMLDLKA